MLLRVFHLNRLRIHQRLHVGLQKGTVRCLRPLLSSTVSFPSPLLLDQFKRYALVGDLILGSPRATQRSTDRKLLKVQTHQFTFLDGGCRVLKVAICTRRHCDRSVLPHLGHEHMDNQLSTITLVHEPVARRHRREVLIVILHQVLRRLVSAGFGKVNGHRFNGETLFCRRKSRLPRAPRNVREFDIVNPKVLHALTVGIVGHRNCVGQDRVH